MKTTHALWIILTLSLLATLGSLYVGRYGDPILNLQSGQLFNPLNAILPCDLCRYIRVFQYPLVIVAAVGLIMREKSTLWISGILSVIGFLITCYKMSLEYGRLVDSGVCLSPVSCADPAVMYRGWLSLPFLGVVVFLICIIVSLLALKGQKQIY